MTKRDTSIDALLWEIHVLIEDSARSALSGVGTELAPLRVTYPPDQKLTDGEREALRGLQLSPEQRSGLLKLIVDAGGAQFFHTFCLIDGVGDPEQFPVDGWIGLSLQAADEDDEQTEMLHDAFFESWRDWKNGVRQMRSKRN